MGPIQHNWCLTKGNLNRQAYKRRTPREHEHEDRDCGDTSISQRMPKMPATHQRAGERPGTDSSPQPLEGTSPVDTLNCKTINFHCLGHSVCDFFVIAALGIKYICYYHYTQRCNRKCLYDEKIGIFIREAKAIKESERTTEKYSI